MAHGTPDWGLTAGQRTVYQLTDLAEAVVRLGSVVSFDRRGDVIFLDSFEAGLGKWTGAIAGDGAAVDLSSARARNGRYSCRLVSGSTDAGGTQFAEIMRVQPYLVLAGLGIECSFAITVVTDYFRLQGTIYDGSEAVVVAVRYNISADTLQYLDADNAWVTFATGLNLVVGDRIFHTLKLVFDPAAKEYVRVLLDDNSYVLADIATRTFASVAQPELDLRITNFGRLDNNDIVHVDDVILTQNEPM